MVGGVNAGILPSSERKVRKTLHQEQIGKQNKRKRKAVHAQAHVRATTLIAEERAMPKEDCQTTVQVGTAKEGRGASVPEDVHREEGSVQMKDGEDQRGER